MIENRSAAGTGAGCWTAGRPPRYERRSGRVTNRELRRSAHRSVVALERDVRGWVNEWNTDPKPFVWIKPADEILETLAAYCQ